MTTALLALRKKMDGAKSVYDAMGYRNVHGKTPEELVQMDIEMHHAKKSWLDAYSEYQRAIEAHIQS
jgi:hypothetical protein